MSQSTPRRCPVSPPRSRSFFALLSAALFVFASCAETVPPPSDSESSSDDFETSSAELVYEHEIGFCEDTDEFGTPYAPPRPVWSDFAGSHYDGIVHTNGAQSMLNQVRLACRVCGWAQCDGGRAAMVRTRWWWWWWWMVLPHLPYSPHWLHVHLLYPHHSVPPCEDGRRRPICVP